jgi:hypothetical protein
MKSKEFIIHGTSSEKDAKNIQKEGFKAEEGRATIYKDLIYAVEWATQKERRRGSKSKTPVGKNEIGRMIIMKLPENRKVDYATHTNIEIDESSKEIKGYSSKYQSGRRQFAIYNEKNIVEKRKKIEKAKKELEEIENAFKTFLQENNINPNQIKSKEDLINATKSFDIEQKIKILQQIEKFEKDIKEKRKEAEPETFISKENILMSIVPTKELQEKLNELNDKIKSLETIDLEKFTEQISQIIKNNKENFIASSLDIKEIIKSLLTSTIETEAVRIIRSLSLDVKRAKGYKIYNRGEKETKEKSVDKEQLKQKLEKIRSIIESNNFNIGIESVNKYIKININKLLKELNS